MSTKRVAHVLFSLMIATSLSLLSSPTAKASDYPTSVSTGVAASSGWFSFFRSRNSKSHYSGQNKKAPPSMSNGSFYEKWRADRKASGRAHRP